MDFSLRTQCRLHCLPIARVTCRRKTRRAPHPSPNALRACGRSGMECSAIAERFRKAVIALATIVGLIRVKTKRDPGRLDDSTRLGLPIRHRAIGDRHGAHLPQQFLLWPRKKPLQHYGSKPYQVTPTPRKLTETIRCNSSTGPGFYVGNRIGDSLQRRIPNADQA
jgi:hypothetical protein